MDPDLQHEIDTWTPRPDRRPEDVDWFPPVFSEAPFGIAAIDLQGNFVRVNPAFCDLHGRNPDEVRTMSIWDFTELDDAAQHEATLALARNGEATHYRNEHRIKRPDGSERWALITATTVHDTDGQPAYALLQYDDTTPLHEAAEAVRQTTEALDITFENAPIAIYSVDLEGRVLTWNPMAEQLFGYRRGEVVGEVIPILPEDRRANAMDGLRRLVQGETISNVESRLRHKDGHEIDVLTSATATHTRDGRADAIVAFAMDLSRQRRVERELQLNQQRMRTVLSKISDTVTVLDERGSIRYSTAQYSDVLGYPRSFWLDHNAFDLLHPDDRDRAEQLLAEALLAPGVEMDDVFRVRNAEGTYVPTEAVVINLLDDPDVEGIVVTTRNLTEFRRTQELLADETRVLEMIARDAPLEETLEGVVLMVEKNTQDGVSGIVLIDEDGNYRTGAAPGFPEELRDRIDRTAQIWPIASAVRERRTIVVSDAQREPPTDEIREAAAELGIGAGWTTPVIESSTGDVLGVICTYYPGPMTPGRHELHVAGLSANLAAIAIDRQRAHDELRRQAQIDPLTGLPNRDQILRRLDEGLRRAESNGKGVAVMFVDLDRFKVINDSLGHNRGDQLLRLVGERLTDLVSPDDVVGRFSADDFIIVLTDVRDHSAVAPLANRIDLAMSEPFRLEDLRDGVYLSASIGVAHSSDGDGSAENLLQLAGAAMYRAKELGRNRVEIFDTRMRTRARERLQLEHDLRLALERDELVIHYQPKVDLSTGQIMGAEALLRWRHPERGLILPTSFIPVAEETGLIVRIGRFVLEEAVGQARRWVDTIPGVRPFLIAVNFSPRQISAPDLVTNVARVLVRHSWPPERLSFELTESMLVDDADGSLDLLNDLKRLGIKLAIDDFGTGFSSLSYLHTFPVDIVKIDRAFVSQLDTSGNGSAIVTAVMHMAEALDLIAAAEGVESAAQLEGLRRLRCHWAQGFYFSKALPADEMTALLEASPRW